MRWFCARLIFRSTVNGTPSDTDIFDESYRVLLATSDEHALSRLETIGREAAHAYPNEAGQAVTWQFIRVDELQDLECAEISDGAEVFSAMSVGDPRQSHSD